MIDGSVLVCVPNAKSRNIPTSDTFEYVISDNTYSDEATVNLYFGSILDPEAATVNSKEQINLTNPKNAEVKGVDTNVRAQIFRKIIDRLQ